MRYEDWEEDDRDDCSESSAKLVTSLAGATERVDHIVDNMSIYCLQLTTDL